MNQLYTAKQVRQLDRIAIDDEGIPGFELMKRAGHRVFSELTTRWPESEVLSIFCGPGNNGGDGYVIAALALKAGLGVKLWQIGDPGRISGDAALAREEYLGLGGQELPGSVAFEAGDVLVDALLGTGLERPLGGEYLAVVQWMNAQSTPVIAVDIPTGLNADTGAVMGDASKADLTITFVGRKQGMYTADAVDHCGTLLFDDLGISDTVYQRLQPSSRLMPDSNRPVLARRLRNSHKGDFGHVLILGGGPGMPGAAIMAGLAALRTGAGKVTVATHPEHAMLIPLVHPELMSSAISSSSDLLPLLEASDTVVFGPGLGTSPWSGMLFNEVIRLECPVVIDADGLNLLARSGGGRGRWVLTPHPAEAARLLGKRTDEIQGDRFAAVTSIAKRYQAEAVLKGAGTLVSGETETWVCSKGNPGMASAGMGDVLSGVIGGLLAQGLDLDAAARLGVYIHASAGDRAAAEGERGLMATDLLDFIRSEVNRL